MGTTVPWSRPERSGRAISSSWDGVPWWRAFSEGLSFAVGGTVRVAGLVEKDVLAFGGASSWKRVRRSVETFFALGGEVHTPAGDTRAVGGRVLTVGQLEAAFAAGFQTSPLAAKPASGLLLAFRLVPFLWLVIGLLLVRFVPRPVSAAAGFLPGRLATMTALGAAGVLTSLLVSAFLLLCCLRRPVSS